MNEFKKKSLWFILIAVSMSGLVIISSVVYSQTEFKLTASDGAVFDNFGNSVSISGGLIVVGARADDNGSAYIFKLTDMGWVEEAKLTVSPSPATNDNFGFSVSISNSLVGVGAPTSGNSGAAYVFKRTDMGWVEEAKLTASDAATNDNFGFSVSISGGLAVVGAPGDDDAGSLSGSAYIFKLTDMGWVEETKLTASDAAASANFGDSVSINDGLVVVGAPTRGSGSAYIFKLTDMGWVEETKLTASDAAASDFFGTSVSISGGLAVVGANGDDDAGSQSGSAYIFKQADMGWVEETKLTASDAAAFDIFGHGVSISGGVVVVGAVGNDDAVGGSGSAYIFKLTDMGWVEETKLTASDAVFNDGFGTSVSVGGDFAIVGAPDDGDGVLSGSAYVYDLTSIALKLSKELASVKSIPDEFALHQNHPNPFNPETMISFQLPERSPVMLKVFNMLGQEIQTLVDRPYTAGSHSIRWDGIDSQGNRVASGTYLYQLQAGSFSQIRKMTLLR